MMNSATVTSFDNPSLGAKCVFFNCVPWMQKMIQEVEKKLRECAQESQIKGRKILIEEVEDEELWGEQYHALHASPPPVIASFLTCHHVTRHGSWDLRLLGGYT